MGFGYHISCCRKRPVHMKNPEDLYDAHIILGTSKIDKFIMSAIISKRFKDYMPSLVSYITALPAAVKPSNLKDSVHCRLLFSNTSYTRFIAHAKVWIGTARKYCIFSSKNNSFIIINSSMHKIVILLAGIYETINLVLQLIYV